MDNNLINKNIKQWILKELEKQHISKYTAIQNLTLPLTLKNQNVIGISPTGTGKTLCFLIPILNKISLNENIQVIIIAPTRELARQIHSNIQLFKTNEIKIKSSLWIGGEEIKKQINNSINTNIVVATPTRFLEIYKTNNINFKNVNTIVLDETDMLFDLGFSEQIITIFNIFKNINEIQKMAFSATIHDMLSQQLKIFFKDTKIVTTKDIYKKENITNLLIKTKDKYHALSVIINQINPYLCLIFANTKKTADLIYKYLLNQNRNVINLHGGLKTRERKNNYRDIKNLKYQYVVCSDLASRGLDIDGASHVINWDLPDDFNWYLHRAGRCGRNKYSGESYILFNDSDNKKILDLINKGVEFKNLTIKNNQLVSTKEKIYHKPKINQEQEKEIKLFVAKAKKNVKPGYKKKLKSEINKIKQKHKRKHIEKVVKENRIKSYKQKND